MKHMVMTLNLKKIKSMNEYILVQWPESQVIMEKEWFSECILMNDENLLNELGSSCYFVPKQYYTEL